VAKGLVPGTALHSTVVELVPASHSGAHQGNLELALPCSPKEQNLSRKEEFGIIEWFGLERTLKIIWFQPPSHEQGDLPPAQAAESPIRPGCDFGFRSHDI